MEIPKLNSVWVNTSKINHGTYSVVIGVKLHKESGVIIDTGVQKWPLHMFLKVNTEVDIAGAGLIAQD